MSKKLKIKIGDLKRLIETTLNEEEKKPFAPQGQKVEIGDSVDTQIDRFLNEYEKEARNSKNEGLDIRSMIHRMIREANEEDSDNQENDEKHELEEIDVESFANDVARLIENFEYLVEIKNVIIRRACNHLIDRYDESVKAAFEESLRDQHGLADNKSKEEIQNDYDAPPADRAGPSLSSGGT